tara:strand:- start:114 stop:1727 length:1614 start_codon:yes stop_codon:yes gene_type:complete
MPRKSTPPSPDAAEAGTTDFGTFGPAPDRPGPSLRGAVKSVVAANRFGAAGDDVAARRSPSDEGAVPEDSSLGDSPATGLRADGFQEITGDTTTIQRSRYGEAPRDELRQDEQALIKKYDILSKEDYDCSLDNGRQWTETLQRHIELEDSDLEGANFIKILSGFFKNDKTLLDDVDSQAAKLRDIPEFKDATTGDDKHFFAYASAWSTYVKNSLKCKTKTIVQSRTNIETVGISMKLKNVFLLFPDETHLVIACRADNNMGGLSSSDPTKSVSTTSNTSSLTNEKYTQEEQAGGADINFGSLSNENYTQEGGAAKNFGVTIDYEVTEFIKTMKPQAREVKRVMGKNTDGYTYEDIGGNAQTVKNLRNMTKIMMKHMSVQLQGATNSFDMSQSGSEKMQEMELHVYRIRSNPQLANKLFASNDYTTKIVNINFPNSNRVLTFGSIHAPNQFLQFDKGGWIDFFIGNTTHDVEKAARKSVGPAMPGGNLNKKQLRNKLNTMSMRELRKLHREEEVPTNNNRSIKGLVNNYMRYNKDSNN